MLIQGKLWDSVRAGLNLVFAIAGLPAIARSFDLNNDLEGPRVAASPIKFQKQN